MKIQGKCIYAWSYYADHNLAATATYNQLRFRVLRAYIQGFEKAKF